MSEIPSNLKYTRDHEWVRLDDDGLVTIGITDHAQQALGEITYVELPPVGKAAARSEELAAVESAKAASDVYAPVGGTVQEVNSALEDAPETINADPYGAGWICKLTGVDSAEISSLLSAEQYKKLLESESA